MKKKAILAAATLVAAFFVFAYSQKNRFIFSLIQKKISEIASENHSLRFIPVSQRQFKLVFLDKDQSEVATSLWSVEWLFRKKALDFSGSVFFRDFLVDLKIRVPLPVQTIQGQVSINQREVSGEAAFEFYQKVDSWVGSLNAKIKHSEWGETSPVIEVELGRSLSLKLNLGTHQLKSKYLKLDKEGKLEIKKEDNIILANLDLPSATLSQRDFVFEIKKGLIKIPKQALRDQIQFQGSFQLNSKHLKLEKKKQNIFFMSRFQGDLIHTPHPSMRIKGVMQDNLNSVEVPFKIERSSKDWNVSAEAKLSLFEQSFVGLLLNEYSQETKILTGKALCKLRDEKIQVKLNESDFIFGNYLLKGAEGHADIGLIPLSFNLSRFQISFAGGRISLAPYQWSQTEKPKELKFKIQGLDSAQFLKSDSTSKIIGKGLFDGEGSLSPGAKGFFLSSLSAWNTTPGTVSYLDPSQMFYKKEIKYLNDFQTLLKQGEQALVLKALENFHFDSLKISAERGNQEDLKLVLNLKGKNPDLAKGQPFNITLPIEGDLDSLVYGSILQKPLTDEINKRKK